MDAGTNPDGRCHVRTRARFSMVFTQDSSRTEWMCSVTALLSTKLFNFFFFFVMNTSCNFTCLHFTNKWQNITVKMNEIF